MKSAFRIITILSISLLWSCEQPEPAFDNRDGDILQFANREWVIKHGEGVMGPGPNYFTDHPNDVFVDQNGYLHLSISQRNGVWRCTEVVSVDTMGYGTYIWTIQGNPVNIDRNVVLGLFTWDTYTFQEQANSEVDIEFSKWGVADQDTTLQYGVQPINFGTYYPERDYKPEADPELWVGVSTHAFTWTDTLITWESWRGDSYGNGTPDASWTFDLNNPPRSKYEGGLWSDPIIIPAPGDNTNARMNYWLLSGPDGPFVPVPHEIIIRNFEYIPL